MPKFALTTMATTSFLVDDDPPLLPGWGVGRSAAGAARLPAYTSEWTDHNTSDPGVTLLELLLYGVDGLWSQGFAAARDGLGHEWPQDRNGSGGGPLGGDALESDSDDMSDNILVG